MRLPDFPMAARGRWQKALVLIVILTFCNIHSSAQQNQEAAEQQAPSAATEEKDVTVLGCLSHPSDFVLSDASGTIYHLTGAPSLEPLVGHELSVSGSTSGNDPEPVLTVTEVKDVLNPAGRLETFSAHDWHSSTNKAYGFSFEYPASFKLLEQSELRKDSNFANSNGSTSLLSVEIPDSIYPGSNFRGGYFTVLVNPNITNGAACNQFGYADPRSVSPVTLGGVRYEQATDSEGAAGTGYTYYYLHSYQNGVCYELKLEMAAVNTGAYELPCSISLVSDENKKQLIEDFVSRVAYFHPTQRELMARAHVPVSKPAVTRFQPSSQPSNGSLEITVSWMTQGADYVQLEFECNNSLVVTGASAYLECGSSSNRNFPPDGSTTFLVSNPKGRAVVPFVVKLEPFSHGTAYPSQLRTVSVPVPPDGK